MHLYTCKREVKKLLNSSPTQHTCRHLKKSQNTFHFLAQISNAIKVLVAIHYSVLDARNGYIRNVVV